MESMRLEGICHIHEKIAVFVDRCGDTFAWMKEKKKKRGEKLLKNANWERKRNISLAEAVAVMVVSARRLT